MSEIKVKEYVRTDSGLIGEVNCIELAGKGTRYAGEFITDTIIQFDDGRVYERRVREKNITKHSKNLIDLIEEGDIVNNSLIVYKGRTASGKEKMLVGNHIIHGMSLRITDVKTILTHEQYERNCYKVK